MNTPTLPKSPCVSGDVALSPSSPTYYGVYLGYNDADGESRTHVYSDRQEALKIAKKCKKSRFKVFCSFEEAENFALNGPEPVCSPGAPIPAERASPFKAPIYQDLVKFRRLLERGDLDEIKWIVSNNPRYLVSSGDTPAILHEGARYNALHIAAKFDQPKICDYVLRCVTDPEFIQKLYGEDTIKETVKQRCDILLDLYLNTPDKGANDTPLHFASKMGALDVIKILISYNKCDKNRRNKQDLTALDIVGTRNNNISLEVKNEIIRLLNSEYYIAVFRPLDPVRPPVLEGPFLMNSSKPNLNSLLDSEMRMSGVAGPMKYEEAINFKKMWKRPRGSPISSPGSPCSPPAFSPSSFKKPDKVIERIGRELCSELDVNWIEYWPFLKGFANFHKESDISLLEMHLSQKCKYGDIYENESQNKLEKVIHIDDLCEEFDKLCNIIGENVDCKNNNEASTSQIDNIEHTNMNKVQNDSISYLHIDKTCQVYANTVVNSVISLDYNGLPSCLDRVNILITSCLLDKRYSCIEFNRIHSKLAALVHRRITESNESDISSCIEFLRRLIETAGTSLNPSSLCLCTKIYSLFQNNPNELSNNRADKNMNSENIEFSWLALDICSCLTNIKNKSSKKRLDFWSRNREKQEDNLNIERVCSINDRNNLYGKNEFDMKAVNSDSEDCFLTPPSSPGKYSCNTEKSIHHDDSSSDSSYLTDDELSDNEMYSADEGNPICIDGNNLTHVDKAVYDALDKNKVSMSKHPYTYLWLQDCQLKFHQLPSTPICSPLSPKYSRTYENMKSFKDFFNYSPLSSK